MLTYHVACVLVYNVNTFELGSKIDVVACAVLVSRVRGCEANASRVDAMSRKSTRS